MITETTQLDRTLDAGVRRLLDLQHEGGWWVGELESNATMIAQHLFWHHVLGLRTPELDRKIANELLARQRDDGTWSIWFEGPPDLSTSIEAYAALGLAGVDPGERARDWIVANGGVRRARVFTKSFLALLGQWPWGWMPTVPVEVNLLPPSAPFSIYNFACWARQTVVPLSVVQALKPVRRADLDLREIGAIPAQPQPSPRPSGVRLKAIRTAERWVRDRQEADGSWGGIQPPWVWSILMLAALGHGFEDETFRRAVEGWEGFTVDEGDRLRPEACQSPVWDTAIAVLALRDAGLSADHPALRRAADWLIGEEVTVKGDWAIRRPGLEPGGWAFEFENDLYPDVDDTAVVALALRRMDTGGDAVDRGLRWVEGMQSRNGGWGAFDADNDALWLYKLPFCDFGRVTDEPSADVTAHALEALAPEKGYERAVADGLAWLLAEQEDDGSWYGRWGVNHVYGTGAALPALAACGLPPEHASLRRAADWLDSVQNADGGFGEDIRSYSDPAWRGRGFSTPSQTAWALLAYDAAGRVHEEEAARAVQYLCSTQGSDGDWEEKHFTGTGFPGDFMIRYHLYRLHFPVMALGRIRERLTR